MEAITVAPSVLREREPGWIYKKPWDLTLLIFSAVLVPIPFLVAWAAERSGLLTQQGAIDLVNMAVAGLVGGPHLLTTFTYTFFDKKFMKRHPVFAFSSLVLPAGVIYMGIFHYGVLIFLFFMWASLHILHQLIYISDCYRQRGGQPDPLWSRLVDYGVIGLGLYPIGLMKLSSGDFAVGNVVLPYPEFLRPFHLPEIAAVVFFSLVILWIFKSLAERAAGRFNVPKTLLIGVTAVVSFCVPMGKELDILFQGYNTWHSFQYLFLFWLINRIRVERGEVENAFIRKLCSGRGIFPYYLFFFLLSGAMVTGVTFAVRSLTTLGAEQSYFIVVLSLLLMHYYFDHFLFTRTEFVA